jgi:hypothetical protein
VNICVVKFLKVEEIHLIVHINIFYSEIYYISLGY